MGGVNGPDLAAWLTAEIAEADRRAAAIGRGDEAPDFGDRNVAVARNVARAQALDEVRGRLVPHHAAIVGERPFREQSAGEVGLTEGTRSDGDAARYGPPVDLAEAERTGAWPYDQSAPSAGGGR